jgi:SAM-dependent methyltransferase
MSTDFQADATRQKRRWDKEWMRYLSMGKDYSAYFSDMDTQHYALQVSPEFVKNATASEMYNALFLHNVRGRVWASGADLVGKNVLELGCGPGMFGRISSRFVKSYTGLDVSPFALSIARLTSRAEVCSFLLLYEPNKIAPLVKSFDTAFGRHFFTHQNYESALWLLKLMRDLTVPGGLLIADFYSSLGTIDGHRTVPARNTAIEGYASALYSYEESDVRQIANDAGIVLLDMKFIPEENVRLAQFRVPSMPA